MKDIYLSMKLGDGNGTINVTLDQSELPRELGGVDIEHAEVEGRLIGEREDGGGGGMRDEGGVSETSLGNGEGRKRRKEKEVKEGGRWDVYPPNEKTSQREQQHYFNSGVTVVHTSPNDREQSKVYLILHNISNPIRIGRRHCLIRNTVTDEVEKLRGERR